MKKEAKAPVDTHGQARGTLPFGLLEITVKEVPTMTYTCLPHKGSLAEIEKVVGQVIAHVNKGEIIPQGPMIGIFYDDPAKVKPEEQRWEIGFPVTDAPVKEPLVKKGWSHTKVAVAIHVGPYEKVNNTYKVMFSWLSRSNLKQVGPVMERYLVKDPFKVKPEELKTECWIPVVEK